MKSITLEDVQALPPEAQLVEVLPREEFEWAHLPGALHVPLRQIDELAGVLDPARPVVTYCHDLLCDLSPRAASWLEHNGFIDVGDFEGGKMQWLAHGLPYEGTADLVARHIDDVPTCGPDDPVSAAATKANGTSLVVVVEDNGIVIGALDKHALEAHGEMRAQDVATLGPTTVRPSEEVEKLGKRMAQRGVAQVIVSDASGHLLGSYHH